MDVVLEYPGDGTAPALICGVCGRMQPFYASLPVVHQWAAFATDYPCGQDDPDSAPGRR